MKVNTTFITQTSNEQLGVKEKKMYYLIIENNIGKKMTINVGEKTHDGVQNLLSTESVHTPEANAQLEKQKKGGKQ